MEGTYSRSNNVSWGKALKSIEATRNTTLAAGISVLGFSLWQYILPGIIAMPHINSLSTMAILKLKLTGLIGVAIAGGAGYGTYHQLNIALQPSKKNPFFYSDDLSRSGVSSRVGFLGLMTLTMLGCWWGLSRTGFIPFHLKQAIYELFFASHACNGVAYGISQAKGNLYV